MNTVNDHAAERAFRTQRRLFTLLTALVEAARTQSFKGLNEGIVDGEPAFIVETVGVSSEDQGHLTSEQLAEVESDSALITHLRGEINRMLVYLDELIESERNLKAFETFLPKSIGDATLELLASEASFAEASTSYQRKLEQWQQLDALTGRTRVRCVRDLMSPTASGGQGMAATAADKAASDHPDYTEHKDRVLAAAIEKDEAEVARDIARARMLNAHLVLRVLSDDRNVEGRVMLTREMEHFTSLRDAVLYLRSELVEIEKGEGAYSADQHKHASNVIENMRTIALRALERTAKPVQS